MFVLKKAARCEITVADAVAGKIGAVEMGTLHQGGGTGPCLTETPTEVRRKSGKSGSHLARSIGSTDGPVLDSRVISTTRACRRKCGASPDHGLRVPRQGPGEGRREARDVVVVALEQRILVPSAHRGSVVTARGENSQ